MGRVDVDELVERTELGAIIADATSGVTQRVLDSLRAHAVGLDSVCNRLVNGVMRRKAEELPAGPPMLVR